MELKQRILKISKDKGLSHIGSCLSVLSILVEIYEKKNPEDIVILDNAHSHLAHLVVKEKYEGLDCIEKLIEDHGIHCDRAAGCDASGGSLGHGIGIGIGMATATRSRNIYVIVSDGSMMEGSNWEALRIKRELKIDNLYIYCNFNGFTAVSSVDKYTFERRIKTFCPDVQFKWTKNGEGFEGVQGHYKTL